MCTQTFRDVRPLEGCWPHWPSRVLLGARWAQMWQLVRLSGEGIQRCTASRWQVMSLATSSLQRLLFQFDNGWILLHLFQNICLLWPRCLHFCPQRNSFSPPDVSGEQSLDCNRMFPGLKTLEKTQQNMRNLPVQLSWGWLILHVFVFFFSTQEFCL